MKTIKKTILNMSIIGVITLFAVACNDSKSELGDKKILKTLSLQATKSFPIEKPLVTLVVPTHTNVSLSTTVTSSELMNKKITTPTKNQTTTIDQLTLMPTIKLLETATYTIIPTSDISILNQFSNEPYIIFIDISHFYYYLQNMITGETRAIFTFEPGTPPGSYHSYEFITWQQDGCEMLMWGEKVQRVNLQGQVLKDLYSFEDLDAVILNVVVNPNEGRIAYEAVGRFITPGVEYSGRFLDVVDLAQPTKVYRLSERNSGEGMLEWSLDGEWLGYAELDENQVQQVYIAMFDGSSRRQITRFTDPKANLQSLHWSPDGEQIAFLYDANVDDPYYSLMVISSMNQETLVNTADVPDSQFEPYNFWWQNESSLVAISQDGIYWIDTTSNQAVNILLNSDLPNGKSHPQSFSNSSLIGFYGRALDEFYIFDPSSQRYSRMPNVHLSFPHESIIEKWIPLPATFPGEVNCKQP